MRSFASAAVVTSAKPAPSAIRYWVTMSVHSLRPAALRWLGGFGRVLPGKVVSSIGISSNFRRFGPIAGVICQLAGHYPKARGNSPLQPLYIYSFLTQLGRTRARPRGIGRKNSYPPRAFFTEHRRQDPVRPHPRPEPRPITFLTCVSERSWAARGIYATVAVCPRDAAQVTRQISAAADNCMTNRR